MDFLHLREMLHSWISSPEIYVSKEALLLPRKLELTAFTNNILSYINLRADIVNGTDSPHYDWCFSASNLILKIASNDSANLVSISHANCTYFHTPKDKCAADFGVNTLNPGGSQAARTGERCTLFDGEYSPSSIIGVVRLRCNTSFKNR